MNESRTVKPGLGVFPIVIAAGMVQEANLRAANIFGSWEQMFANPVISIKIRTRSVLVVS